MDASPLEPSPLKPASLVLVEDHGLMRDLLAGALQSERTVKVAGAFGTVTDGIKGILKLRPNLVVLNWILPDGKGIQIIHAVAEKLPATRFLFLSSLEKEHVVREALDVGVHGFVMKREPSGIFMEAIRTVQQGRSYYCPTSSRLLIEALRMATASTPRTLTAREREILRGLARGDSAKVMAGRFGLSPKTVSNQLGTLKEKLGIHDTVRLVRYAVDHGLVDDF